MSGAPPNKILENTAFDIIFLIIAGLLVGLQGPINGRLAHYSSGTFSSAFNFFLGFWPLFIFFMGQSKGGKEINEEPADWHTSAKNSIWWSWLGGIFGSIFVLILTTIIPKRGAGITIGIIVSAQLIASVITDDQGWFRVTQHKCTAVRGVGAALLVVGIVFVTLF